MTTSPLNSSTSSETSSTTNTLDLLLATTPDAHLITVELSDHKPLGCRIEESLVPGQPHVFVMGLTEQGHAEKAGIQIGDVIVGVTGLFGAMEDVTGMGIEKV
jgi:predicted metalloprotease with PDZ domain